MLRIGPYSRKFPTHGLTSQTAWVPPESFLRRLPTANTIAGRHVVQHLQWMLQKDLLGQDMLLLGCPGPLRRRIVLSYCHIARREVEMLLIHADTSDGDLRERRDLLPSSTIQYSPQPPLLAAQHGRVLLLEDIHKAERNVLPSLNNLLENREMNLDSGRRLVPCSVGGAAAITEGNIIVCHCDFRVVALGAPVPQFPGYPLDPPFRSRFQCRFVDQNFGGIEAAVEYVEKVYNVTNASTLVKHYFESVPTHSSELPVGERAMLSPSKSNTVSSGTLPICPVDVLFRLASTSDVVDHVVDPANLLKYYPRWAFAQCPSGDDEAPSTAADVNSTVAAMLKRKEPFCIVGPRCSGKTSALMKQLHELQCPVRIISCYKEMNVSDFHQRRVLNADAASAWVDGAVVQQIKSQKFGVVVLDGVHRCPLGALNALSSLVEDDVLQLPSGERLGGCGEGSAWLLVGVGECTSPNWITTEVISIFRGGFIETKTASLAEVTVSAEQGNVAGSLLLKALRALQPLVPNLYTSRTTRRMLRRLKAVEALDTPMLRRVLRETLCEQLLVPFLPASKRSAIYDALRPDVAVTNKEPPQKVQFAETDTAVTIGSVTLQKHTENVGSLLIPSQAVFFNINGGTPKKKNSRGLAVQ